MFLKSLKLKNFRNYYTTEHSFNTPTTILIGDNAQGKSNFLESIYFLATTKSQRAEKDEELIKSEDGMLRVEGVIENQGETTKLVITLHLAEGNLKKRVGVNGIPRRAADYSEHLAVVVFAPEDINLVTGSPSLRRNHIDQILSQVDRHYKKTLSGYENIVIRKNKLLKMIREGSANPLELAYWTEQQIELGEQLTDKRYELFNFINSAQKKFDPSADGFKYEYLPSILTSARLMEYQQREIESTVSLIGPHRDDFAFLIHHPKILRSAQDDSTRDLSKYGSRGEQRTAVLDLKITETSFMEQKMGSRPVLLLDDIFSELDLEHKKHVVELAKLQQTIITTVEMDKYLQSQFKDAQVLKVEEGKILLSFLLKPGS